MQEIWDAGSIPGIGRSPGEGNGNPLQHSCLENPMDRGAWQAMVLGIARVRQDLVLPFFLQFCKELEDTVYPWKQNPDLTQRLHCNLLAALPLSLHPFPSLISNCSNLPFGTQGRWWRLESIPYKQEMEHTERFPCPGASQVSAYFQ